MAFPVFNGLDKALVADDRAPEHAALRDGGHTLTAAAAALAQWSTKRAAVVKRVVAADMKLVAAARAESRGARRVGPGAPPELDAIPAALDAFENLLSILAKES